MTTLIPTYECEFRIGQAVKLAKPYAEDDPDKVYFVLGIAWEHRKIAHHGWSITIATEEEILRGYGAVDGFAPSDLRPADQFQYKTYRQEWQAQTGYVDQYGLNFKPDHVKGFPTRDQAKDYLETIATYDERLMRWEAGKPYQEGRIVHREVLIDEEVRHG